MLAHPSCNSCEIHVLLCLLSRVQIALSSQQTIVSPQEATLRQISSYPVRVIAAFISFQHCGNNWHGSEFYAQSRKMKTFVNLEKLENKMNDQQTSTTTRFRGLFAAALVLACSFVCVSGASAQDVTPPPTPTLITPPVGNAAFLVGHATGTQGYVCLPTPTGASWTVNTARPEATLFTKYFGQDVQIITHFLSPDTNPNKYAPSPLDFANATWQSSFDSSKVWAHTVHSIVAGTDPNSCSHAGSIPCLLLQSIGNAEGPTGGKLLAKTTFVQRLNTQGGLAPLTGCAVATDVSKQTLVPYSADYYFFHREE